MHLPSSQQDDNHQKAAAAVPTGNGRQPSPIPQETNTQQQEDGEVRPPARKQQQQHRDDYSPDSRSKSRRATDREESGEIREDDGGGDGEREDGDEKRGEKRRRKSHRKSRKHSRSYSRSRSPTRSISRELAAGGGGGGGGRSRRNRSRSRSYDGHHRDQDRRDRKRRRKEESRSGRHRRYSDDDEDGGGGGGRNRERQHRDRDIGRDRDRGGYERERERERGRYRSPSRERRDRERERDRSSQRQGVTTYTTPAVNPHLHHQRQPPLASATARTAPYPMHHAAAAQHLPPPFLPGGARAPHPQLPPPLAYPPHQPHPPIPVPMDYHVRNHHHPSHYHSNSYPPPMSSLHWPQDQAPPTTTAPPPPSPDITTYVEAMGAALKMDLMPENEQLDPGALVASINAVEDQFRGKEGHIWAAQQKLQGRLLRVLEGHVEDPFDQVIETLRPQPPPDVYADGELPTVMPLEPVVGAASADGVHDPRMEYVKEYAAVAEFVQRPLPLAFLSDGTTTAAADGAADGTAAAAAAAAIVASSATRRGRGEEGEGGVTRARSYSWSQLPGADEGEPEVTTTKSNPIDQTAKKLLQASGLVGGSAAGSLRPSSQQQAADNILNAPAAPTHDDAFSLYNKSLPSFHRQQSSHYLSSGGGGGDASLAAGDAGPKLTEIEEGYFHIVLPNGTEDKGQYSGLLEKVTAGKVPSGWPVFRPEDQLYLPLAESFKEEALEWRHAAALKPYDQKKGGSGGGSTSVWDTKTLQDVGSEVTFDFTALAEQHPVLRKEKTKKKKPGMQRKESVAAAVAMAKGEKKKTAAECINIDGVDMSLKDADGAAIVNLREQREKERTTQNLASAATAAVTSAAPPAHVLAAVHRELLQNREGIRSVARSVLQSALRAVIEQRETKNKKQKQNK